MSLADYRRHQLDNAETWVTRDGRAIRYEDMTPSHRVNTLRMLIRQADRHALGYLLPLMPPPGSQAELEVDLMELEAAQNPQRWILTTPCGKRLAELIRQDGNGHLVDMP